MSEGSHLRVGESGEEGDHRVHHVLVVYDAVLTLPDQNADELAEVVAELFPHRARHGQRVIPTVLWTKTKPRLRLKLTQRLCHFSRRWLPHRTPLSSYE